MRAGISEPHIQDPGRATPIEDQGNDHSQQSQAAAASLQARQKRRIAQLEEKLVALESGRTGKEKQTNYFVAQGRAIRRIVTLFETIKDLITENDRRHEVEDDAESTLDEDRLQVGYIALTNALPWLPTRAAEMDYDEYSHMLKLLWQGADSARGDDTSKLKSLVAEWINREFKPNPLVDTDDKHTRGFTNDAYHSDGHIYTANPNDLEDGLFKSKLLLQAYKAVFTSPSSAKDVERDGDGIDKSAFEIRVKKHIAQIIKMRKVTPHSISLSSVTSWRSIDGDFDYEQFWRIAPGRIAQRRVDALLEWWTRKVFGRNNRDDLTSTAKASMSVNALARQREQRDDAAFDSP
ncbi:hypothetical protein F4604DRAFT_1777480 [Suillus subluteus]|nr:hypothetical protein F4604DRAFT_1777480 [Suillus subluteus]